MSNYIIINDELYHYGVPGMKWGVRRDARILTNYHRNAAIRKAKDQYKSGKIDKDTYKKRKQQANLNKKKELSDIENSFRKAKSQREIDSLSKNISKRTLSEVPQASIKRGLHTTNLMLGTYNSTYIGMVAGAAAIANPAFAVTAIGAGAVGIAAEVGAHALARMGIDRLS